MDSSVVKKMRKLFPDLKFNQLRQVCNIYASYICILELDGTEITEEKIKSVMDTITFSVKNTLNLRKI